jgi:hypothetical protein
VSLIGERIDVAIRITDNPEPGDCPPAWGLSFGAVRVAALATAERPAADAGRSQRT